jgi:DNA-binding CsgD family transcriptional regulator
MKIKNAVVALYEQGLGGVTIARKLGLHPQTVYYHLRHIKKPNGGRQAKTSKEEVRRLYEEEQLSCQQIADQLGLTSSAVVYTRLKNMGIKLRSKSDGMRIRGITKIGSDNDVIDKYQSGMSQKDIAETYNLFSSDTIRTVLNKYNINESNRGPRNPSWKGGITPLAKIIRTSAQYLDFRNECFRKASYCSELTGNKYNNVNMHHIVDFAFILNNLTDHDDWSACSYLWNVQNSIVVSEEEHKEIHSEKKLDIDFKRFSVKSILNKDCELLLKRYHYLSTVPKNSRFAYGLFVNESLVGCCLFGSGANRFLSSGVGGPALELTRLCLVNWLPKNSASFFLARAIKQLKKDASDIQFLVSFADPNIGHLGGVYKACNWEYTGQCKKDYIYELPDGSRVHKSRFRCKNGKTEKQLAIEAGAVKVPQDGKHRYVYSVFFSRPSHQQGALWLAKQKF